MINAASSVMRFGSFEADLSTGELRKNGRAVKLQPQPFKVLALLLERRGELVSRQEIHQQMWGNDTFVDFEQGLNFAIKKIREALDDDAEQPRYVETLPRRGYRFIASLEQVRNLETQREISQQPTTIPGNQLAAVAEGLGPSHKAMGMESPGTSALAVAAAPDLELSPDGSVADARTARAENSGNWNWWLLAVALALTFAALASGWYVWRSRPATTAITQTQLTENSPEVDVLDAAISPDGKALAYADDTGLYLKLIQSGEVYSLPAPADARISGISWFPDNTSLLAAATSTTDSSSNLWAVSIFGGSPRLLRRGVRQVAVSPDGAKIAFTTGPNNEIWVMEADGQGAKRIALPEEGNDIGNPVWYPKRRRIAYVSDNHRGTFTLQSFDEDTGQTVESGLFSAPSSAVGGGFIGGNFAGGDYGSFCVLSDGRIIYASNDALWEIKTDPRTGLSAGERRQISEWSGADFLDGLHVSADGKRLVLLRGVAVRSVFVAELEDGGKRLRNTRRLTIFGRASYAHAWTPDSQAVVFESYRDGRYEIFKQRLDKRVAEPLVTGKEDTTAGRFTPDGTWLLYSLGSPPKLMRMPASGGSPELVLGIPNLDRCFCTRLPLNFCLAGVRDGKQLVFYAFDPGKKLPPGGIPQNQLREVARTDFGPIDWGLSPDGSSIAMVRPDDPEGRIHILTLPNPARHAAEGIRDVVVAGRSGFMELNWAADGKGWYVANPSVLDEAHFFYIDLRGRSTVLKSPESVSTPWGVPSPDGRHLAFMNATMSRNAWLVENF